MTEERISAYWQVLRLATENAPVDEFVNKAREAKEEISSAWWELYRRSNVLDNLVADLAPEVEWHTGVNTGGRDPYGRPTADLRVVEAPRFSVRQVPGRAARSDRIIEIADALSEADDDDTVYTSAVVEALQREGYEGNKRNLSVSVGNVLFRADGWMRQAAGKYIRIIGLD